MKLTKKYFLFLTAVTLLIIGSATHATEPDTAWTVTLPENQYVGSARFSNDDSLLKVRIAVLSGDGTTVDSSIYVNYNSYTGEAVDTILHSNNPFPKNVTIGTFKPQTDLVYCVQNSHFDSLNNQVDEYRFFIYDDKLDVVIDSMDFPTNEPSLRPDTSRISRMSFTPDGSKLYMIVNVIEDYDEYTGNPIYTDQLFVWDTSDWTIHRKEEYWHTDNWMFGILPNNKMYYVFWEDTYQQEVDCYFFRDMEVDTNIYELCEDEMLEYGILRFPKTDTTKFINFVYDKNNGYRTKLQVRSQSDISLIKTIDNDTLENALYPIVADSRYIVFAQGDFDIYGNVTIFDIIDEYVVYTYPEWPFLGNQGYAVLRLSNNHQMIVEAWGRTLRMLNAKYTTTSAEEPSDEPSSMLYPNPAGDYVEISGVILSGAKIRENGEAHPVVLVYNVLGQIQSTSVNFVDTSASGGQVRIDISSLSPGVYFVRVGGRMYKFVKM